MRNPQLINEYRLLDRDIATFVDRLHGSRDFELQSFIPDIALKSGYQAEIEALRERVLKLDKPNPVFELVVSHHLDYMNALKQSFPKSYQRPSRYIGSAYYAFSYMANKDSRPEEERVGILLKRMSQQQARWNGVKTWLPEVSASYLQEAADSCTLISETLKFEAGRLDTYFTSVSKSLFAELEDAVKNAAAMLLDWRADIVNVLSSKGVSVTAGTTEDDVVKLPEEYYRDLLANEVGVNLDEILSWHEEEIQKTRQEVFEIASRLKISDPQPKTMAEVNALLLKYAGPADSPEEMYVRANAYIKRTHEACRDYVWLPDGENCLITKVPENLKLSYPWGGYGGGCPRRRPLIGEMFLNNYNFKAVTDGWIKVNTVHEAYPGHHVQFVRTTVDPIPETVKMGAKQIPITEGTAHRSERLFEFLFEEDQFYPLFVAYRRHHTAVRIKADLMLRYFGNTIGEVVALYQSELGFDHNTARGQVKAQEGMQGYFTTYYYGMKKICDWEKQYGFDEKQYTELLFSAGRISLENFHKFILLPEVDRKSYLNDFASMMKQ